MSPPLTVGKGRRSSDRAGLGCGSPPVARVMGSISRRKEMGKLVEQRKKKHKHPSHCRVTPFLASPTPTDLAQLWCPRSGQLPQMHTEQQCFPIEPGATVESQKESQSLKNTSEPLLELMWEPPWGPLRHNHEELGWSWTPGWVSCQGTNIFAFYPQTHQT